MISTMNFSKREAFMDIHLSSVDAQIREVVKQLALLISCLQRKLNRFLKAVSELAEYMEIDMQYLKEILSFMPG